MLSDDLRHTLGNLSIDDLRRQKNHLSSELVYEESEHQRLRAAMWARLSAALPPEERRAEEQLQMLLKALKPLWNAPTPQDYEMSADDIYWFYPGDSGDGVTAGQFKRLSDQIEISLYGATNQALFENIGVEPSLRLASDPPSRRLENLISALQPLAACPGVEC
jgi:hypothetical protein